MKENETWSFRIGDTYVRNFAILKYTSDIDEVYFSVKKSDDDKKVILQKTLDNGITLMDDVLEGGVRKRTYQLWIDADDTEDMKVDVEYPFDIEIVTEKEDTDIKQTIIKGTVTLSAATTRKWNEVE